MKMCSLHKNRSFNRDQINLLKKRGYICRCSGVYTEDRSIKVFCFYHVELDCNKNKALCAKNKESL
jgi:hypothetical protein